jgi:predicted neuraminidase
MKIQAQWWKVSSVLILVGTLIGGFALAAPAPEEAAEVKTQDAGLEPEAFQQKVEAVQGRVDFVFGDERPFAQCHASTVVEAADGTLLCAWFGGTEEKNPDVGVWLSRYAGGSWTAPERGAKVSETAHWNPVLFRDAENTIYLFFKVGLDVPQWQTYWMKSTDHGKTWNAPVELVPGDIGGRGPVKNKPIILSDGAWLAPASVEPMRWMAFSDRSTDHGLTWTRSEDWAIDPKIIKGKGAIQPTLWESAPGKVHALMRTTGGVTGRADSEDGGVTWSAVYPTALPNNNSGLDALRLDDGRVLLVYNPVKMNWGPRTPLDLAVSGDNGQTWKTIAHLENDPTLKEEFSYPAIVRTKAGIAVSYTWKRQRVRCWQIPLEAL